MLQKNSRLRQLTLDKNELEGKRLRILREMCMNNNGLVWMSMAHCGLGEEGAFFMC